MSEHIVFYFSFFKFTTLQKKREIGLGTLTAELQGNVADFLMYSLWVYFGKNFST